MQTRRHIVTITIQIPASGKCLISVSVCLVIVTSENLSIFMCNVAC